MGMPITFALVALMVLVYLKFPHIIDESCTATKNVDPKQWFPSIFHHRNKEHFVFQTISLLWKGMLLEGSIGSRRFASTVFKLLVTTEGMIVIAVQGWQLWGAAETYPSICHGPLWRIHFGMYGVILSAYKNRNALVIAALFTAELGFLYFLFPVVSLSCPASGTLAGFLCSFVPQIIISCRKMVWSCVLCASPVTDVEERSDPEGLVWNCQSCPSENGVYFHACERCGSPRLSVANDDSAMETSLINRMSNPELIGLTELQSSDRIEQVWNCMSCPSQNGVYFHACERCGAPRSVMETTLISRVSNPEATELTELQSSDRTEQVWNCMSCQSWNGVYFPSCEFCHTARPISD